MVAAVSGSAFNAGTYLSQIEGHSTGTNTGISPASTPSSGSTSSDSTNTDSTDGVSLSPQLLALLQQISSDSTSNSSLASLLGGASSNGNSGGSLSALLGGSTNAVSSSDPLAGVYNTLLYSVSTTQPLLTAIQTTENQQAQAATQTNPLQNILNSFNSASNAYNQTLLQNAQAVLKANNGTLNSLVA